ncbi:hypothetical protein H633G_07979 [Metarhizium anisopliae BRIP 53284]|nr:hypothetical protein H633G_07979 [Metarhizium anisopliae BRIP 53284]
MSWIAVPSRLYYKLKRNTHAAPKPTTGPLPSPPPAAVQPRRPPNTRLCHPPAMNLALLPYTVFFEIVSHLSAPEALASRRISRDVRSALVRPDLSISLILLHFPRSIEGRALRGHLRAGRHGPLEEEDWAAVFATLARRYHHLGSATPWRVDKVVRRVRLSHGILVVEWCEEEQGRDEPDGVGAAAHRHFATAIIRRIANDHLSGWGVRQADTPRLRALALDRNTWDADARSATGHVFLVEEEHRWCAGPHSSATPPRQHHLRTTGIPLVGDGPRWVDDCGGRGTFAEHGMEFSPRGCRASCADDGVDGVDAAEDFSAWPGRTPCWRHDDFPYLTVSEAHDALAGVRITARHCFMMETLSVHVRPRLCVEGVARYRSGDRAHAAPDDDEVRFEDGLWPQLMGKGCIAGDERWVVGEDEDGDVTILMF